MIIKCKKCGSEFENKSEVNNPIEYCNKCFDEISNNNLKKNEEFKPKFNKATVISKKFLSNMTLIEKNDFLVKIGNEYIFSGISEFKLAKKYKIPLEIVEEALNYVAENGVSTSIEIEKKMKLMESRKNKSIIYRLIEESLVELDENTGKDGYIPNFTRMSITKLMKEAREFMIFESDILGIIGETNNNSDIIKNAMLELHERLSEDDYGF